MHSAEIPSARPYLLRAWHEWCTDNGFTPYAVVRVNNAVRVPREYVNNGEIVLNISYDATHGLHIDNEYLQFKARFGGRPHDILVPVERIVAIYARENGQGMAFPLEEQEPQDAVAPAMDTYETQQALTADPVHLTAIDGDAGNHVASDGDDDPPPPPPMTGGKPVLKLVK